MSFITKRERVFNEYNFLDLPSRNEGKLKAYASCTDARAWSHFCTDKSDHLVEIIKRNNETCRPKYVPTDVIVNTLMVTKNVEINRLRRKIEEFEQLLAAYDQLDLTSEQKVEIANAHAAIKAANKELDDMCLDLDLSGYTEGIDSEAFQTGKSRGDEVSRHKDFESETSRGTVWSFDKMSISNKETRSSQTGGQSCLCDASTVAVDPRIDEMQETIISKDAKLNAMRNTIAVMENDICEPYCVYAHIYTALEKIYGILCQNEKYKQYLEVLTSGKDTRNVDIKGKIFYKLKVFEKFCCALISPCSNNCSCYHAEIISRVETAFALKTDEYSKNYVDNKRAYLVADIMGNEEIKELLEKNSSFDKIKEIAADDKYVNSKTESENLNRLKDLQASYEDLLVCYDDLRFERNCLTMKCAKYEELEKEFNILHNQLNSYNSLWNEKEYYKTRSEDIDNLKEKYLELADETLHLETQVKSLEEIKSVKCFTIDQLREDNSVLQKKLNEVLAGCEKERHTLECKLKVSECKIMCQEQQIKSLSLEIKKFVENDYKKTSDEIDLDTAPLYNNIESLKEEINNLKNALFYKDEENHQLQLEYQEKLLIINKLRLEIEDWRRTYEQQTQRYNYLEKVSHEAQDELQKLSEENKNLTQEIRSKSVTIDNLKNVISNKSFENSKLASEIESYVQQNEQLHKMNELCHSKINSLEIEREEALHSLEVTSQESGLMLGQYFKANDLKFHKNKESNKLDADKTSVGKTSNEKESTLKNSSNSNLLNKIDLLRLNNTDTIKKIVSKSNESLRILKINEEQSEKIGIKDQEIEALKKSVDDAEKRIESIQYENTNIVKALGEKMNQIKLVNDELQIIKDEKQLLLNQLEDMESIKEYLSQLKCENKAITERKNNLENDILLKNEEIKNLCNLVKKLEMSKQKYDSLYNRIKSIEHKTTLLDRAIEQLSLEKKHILEEINLHKKELTRSLVNLETTKNDNNKLLADLKYLEEQNNLLQAKLRSMEYENSKLNNVIAENNSLKYKVDASATLENELCVIKQHYEELKICKDKLEHDFKSQLDNLETMRKGNQELRDENNILEKHVKDLENALVSAREELQSQSVLPSYSYMDLKEQIEKIQKEKDTSQTLIKTLYDKLYESDGTILNLTHDLLERDNKISMLENQVNEFGSEIIKLQTNLSCVVELGEEISSKKQEMDQSLKQMEAHHSRATHNMRIEIAKLMNDTVKLNDPLKSSTVDIGILTDNLDRYNSNEIGLQNEKKKLVTQIQQLEISCLGHSALSPNAYGYDNIIKSVENIGKYIEARNNSCHLILGKADEAKRIIEKEKQKVIKEKDDAIKDKTEIQNELTMVKEALEQQKIKDKSIIKDLEAELLNQKLLIEKINQSTQSYINNLAEKLQATTGFYEESLKKVSNLESDLKTAYEKCDQRDEIFQDIKNNLDKKCQEIISLENILNSLTNKETANVAVQTSALKTMCNISIQSVIDNKTINKDNYLHINDGNERVIDNIKSFDEKFIMKSEDDQQLTINKTQHNPLLDIQVPKFRNTTIFNADGEPILAFIKDIYLNYKINKLGLRQIEQYSFAAPVNELETFQELDYNDHPKTEIIHQETISNTDVTNLQSGYVNSNNCYSSEHDESSIIKSIGNMDQFQSDTFSDDPKENYDESMDDKATGNNNTTNIYPKDNIGKEVDINSQLVAKTDGGNKLESSQSPLYRIITAKLQEPNVFKENGQELEKKNLFENNYHSIDHSLSETSYFMINNNDAKYKQKTNDEKMQKLNNEMIQHKIIKQSNSVKSLTSSSEYRTLNNNNKIDLNNNFYSITNKHFENAMATQSGNQKIIEKNKFKHQKKPNALADFSFKNSLNHVEHKNETHNNGIKNNNSRSNKTVNVSNLSATNSSTSKKLSLLHSFSKSASNSNLKYSHNSVRTNDVALMVQMDNINEYHKKIKSLEGTIENIDRDYKEKIRAIKAQYDNNIKNIMNEHNQGVQSLQNLHEETLQDIFKVHENETENLRSMSIEAMRKVDKLELENKVLKSKIKTSNTTLDEEPTKIISSYEIQKAGTKRGSHYNVKTLTKTTVDEFSVSPKGRAPGPCTCTLDINVSDTIRNIFEQVDVEQRRIAEQAYLKCIVNKILANNVEALDLQELSFLHLKVCRTWKIMLRREEALHKRIGTLESDLLNKQKQTQKHIAELNRKVAEERRRLQEVREAVCQDSPADPRSNDAKLKAVFESNTTDQDLNLARNRIDLATVVCCPERRFRHTTGRERRIAKMDGEERRDRKQYCDERPTRLRRCNDCLNLRSYKK